jgi:hypothetical protein
MLFIDGDHTYEGCLKDWTMYSPLVRSGGLIAFHDIADHTTDKSVGVRRAWLKASEGKRSLGILSEDGEPWAGIGLVWKD